MGNMSTKPSYRQNARELKEVKKNNNQLRAELKYMVALLYTLSPEHEFFKQIDPNFLTMEEIKLLAKQVEEN